MRNILFRAVPLAATLCLLGLGLGAAPAGALVHPNGTLQCATASGECVSLSSGLHPGWVWNANGGAKAGNRVVLRAASRAYSNEDFTNVGADSPFETVFQFNHLHPGVLSQFIAGKYPAYLIVQNEATPDGNLSGLCVVWVPNHGLRLGSCDNPASYWVIKGTFGSPLINGLSTSSANPDVATAGENQYTPNRYKITVGNLGGTPTQVPDSQTWFAHFGELP
jgi:hypothetical protein